MVLCVADQRAISRYHSLQRMQVSEQEVNTTPRKSFNRTAGVLTDRKGSDAMIIQGNEEVSSSTSFMEWGLGTGLRESAIFTSPVASSIMKI